MYGEEWILGVTSRECLSYVIISQNIIEVMHVCYIHGHTWRRTKRLYHSRGDFQ